jgi:hypothetical protein
LKVIAKKHKVNLQAFVRQPALKWAALGELCCFEEKEKYPLAAWNEAVSYLLGCDVQFESYDEIGKSLKPFSLKMR